MFKHRLYEKASFRTYFYWLLMSFLAGGVNTGGYLSCNRFVSHVTGFATLAGVSGAAGHFTDFIGYSIIPGFFLLGVMVSAFLTERSRSFSGKLIQQQNRYAPVLALSGLLLATVGFLGNSGFFGAFGKAADLHHDFILLAALCMACGLQNSAITSASGATVRTTHLTGLTTDLGLGLVRSRLGHLSREEKVIEKRANMLRLMTVLAFTFGSAAGALIFFRWQFLGFSYLACLSFYLWFMTSNDI